MLKSEFYWALISSLIVALAMSLYQHLSFLNDIPGLAGYETISGFSYSLLPFVGIYFIVGVLMLFSKKSESFAKGLLLSALILFFIMIFLPIVFIRF